MNSIQLKYANNFNIITTLRIKEVYKETNIKL